MRMTMRNDGQATADYPAETKDEVVSRRLNVTVASDIPINPLARYDTKEQAARSKWRFWMDHRDDRVRERMHLVRSQLAGDIATTCKHRVALRLHRNLQAVFAVFGWAPRYDVAAVIAKEYAPRCLPCAEGCPGAARSARQVRAIVNEGLIEAPAWTQVRPWTFPRDDDS
jgi:hypothetical protein